MDYEDCLDHSAAFLQFAEKECFFDDRLHKELLFPNFAVLENKKKRGRGNMLLFDSLFREADSKEIMYKGKKVQRIFNIRNLEKYRIRFTFVKTNSPYTQVIKVFFVDFRGEIYLEGRKIQLNSPTR